MEGAIKIWNDEGEVYELRLTKKDIKLLKNIVMDLEKVYIRSGLQGQKLKEACANDKRIDLLDRIVNNQIVWHKPLLDNKE